MGIIDRFEFDQIAGHAAHELPRTGADRVLAEAFVTNFLDVLLGHHLPFLEHRAGQARGEMDLHALGEDADGDLYIIDFNGGIYKLINKN